MSKTFKFFQEKRDGQHIRINCYKTICHYKALHNAGCKTCVSIEPYPTPNIIEQNFDEILHAVSFCDMIIFGCLHYNKKVSEYKQHKKFFNELAQQVIDFCVANGKNYHIKTGTISK